MQFDLKSDGELDHSTISRTKFCGFGK